MSKRHYYQLPLNSNFHATIEMNELARLTGCAPKTVKRWIDGVQIPHRHTLELARLRYLGLLPDPKFEGFTVTNGILKTPSGDQITVRDLEAFFWLRSIYYSATSSK